METLRVAAVGTDLDCGPGCSPALCDTQRRSSSNMLPVTLHKCYVFSFYLFTHLEGKTSKFKVTRPITAEMESVPRVVF